MVLLGSQLLLTDETQNEGPAHSTEPSPATRDRSKPASSRLEERALLALTVAYCVWVFSLPLFPTQDGAVHLYYAQALSHLLSGSQLYSQFFAIRHPLPPYQFHYLLLIGLTKLVRPLLAEKIVVCLMIVGFVYGFRALARKVGPSAGLVTLWIVPLSLNWMVGMGFHNFCLSMALGFWAMAAWLHAVSRRSSCSWAVYYALLLLVLFTHPVPLLITVAFAVSELLLRMTRRWFSKPNRIMFADRFHGLRTDIAFASFSLLAVGYIALFIKHDPAPNDLHPAHMAFKTLLSLASLKSLSIIGKTPAAYAYRLSFYLILACAVRFALRGFRERWRKRQLQVSDLLLLGSLTLGIAFPLLPRSMNGADFFADRLIIYIWIGAIGAAACQPLRSARFHRFASSAAFLFALGALLLTDHYVRPVAERVALLECVRSQAPGTRGIFVNSPVGPDTSTVSFDPYVWASARYFRQTDSVMLNAPWLDLPLSPLEARGEQFANLFTYINDYPDRFRDLLMHSKAVRESIAPLPEFIVAAEDSESVGLDPLLRNLWPQQLTCERINWDSSVCQVAGRAR